MGLDFQAALHLSSDFNHSPFSNRAQIDG
jgi:hypothetical protein